MENISISKEKKRIYQLLESNDISQKKIDAVESIIDEVAFMRVKLIETRRDLELSGVFFPIDGNDGQTRIRENPQYKGYEALLKSYLSAMDRILSLLPKEAQDSIEKKTNEESVLELVRSMHKKSV